MAEPRQIEIARSLIGTHEGDNPVILGFARKIGELYPEMKSYAANYTSDGIAWCGVFVAYCMAMSGIRPVFGAADIDKWMWAQAWKQFGTATSAPQIGDVLVLARHVTMYAGTRDGRYIGLGGNQSDSVKESLYSADSVEAIRRPPQAAQISTEPDKHAAPFVPLDQRTIDAITAAAASSDLAQYSWRDRGRAPIGYIKGMAVTFGTALRKLAARDSAALAMVRVVEGPGDVFDKYDLGTLGAPDVDRLRALWTVLTGLGMRESSGNYSEGRDMSASNTSADEAEAGLFQQSWNSHTTSSEIPKLLSAYESDKPGLIEIFREGVRAKDTDTFGSGDGAVFQVIAKRKPAFAVEAAAIGLRTLYTHWGPIIRHEAEVVPAADALFRQVQEIVGIVPATQVKKDSPMPDQPAPTQQDGPVTQRPALPQLPAISLPKIDMTAGIPYILAERDKARADIKALLNIFNGAHPDVAIQLPPAPGGAAPAPATTPIHQTPAFQIGALGGVLTGILHQFGVIDPNMAILGAIVSAGTAFLGPSGAIVGTVVMNLIRAAAAASAQK